MSNSYITPTHQTIGEYKITDTLFNASFLDTTIDGFKSISASFNEKITQNVNDIEYLSSVLSTLNLKALKHSITNVGILRPDDANELYLKIDVFDSAEMSTKLGTIDLSGFDDWKYFEALLVNNGENHPDLIFDPLRPEYFPGTQWIGPSKIDDAIKEYGTSTGFQGYGPAFNNSPVNVSFLAWLEDHNLVQDLTQQSKFYLRFIWYYIDAQSEVHSSDHFSMVVPSYAEVGAKAGSSISKSEIYEIKQVFETQVATVSYTTEEDEQHPIQGYYIQSYQCTILEDFEANTKRIILQDYSEGKTYKLKFKTGSSDISIGTSATTSNIAFYADYGNGAEKIDELNASNAIFSANSTYLIAVNLGMIQVIAKI